MPSNQFQNLFTPLQIGPIKVKNRIAFVAHHPRFRFYGDDELPDQFVEYHRARAKGGCGLIIIGSTQVHESSTGFGTRISHDPEKFVPKLRRIADAIHEHGTKAIMQLMHRGCEMDSMDNIHALWGFTQRPTPTAQEVCHEMDDDEIREIIEAFVRNAKYMKEAGLDGVELHGSHGYLIQQSWSPFANQRTDKWGNDHFAFARELINRVRNQVGKDFVVGVRIPTDDWWPGPGGMPNERMREIAQMLEATGKIDYISCSEGSMVKHYALSIGPMFVPPAAWVPLASGIRDAVQKIPVIAVGRINDPVLAEKILADGHADMVGLVRAQICDPEFARKAYEGRLDEIRACVACNQGCIDRLFAKMPITCLQNATVGREWEIGTAVERAPQIKRVLVVGGGPGGMEAARVAALRGHDVTLMEKETELGGQVNIATKVPSRQEFGGITRFLAMQLQKLRVKVRIGVDANEDLIRRENPDTVIVATGSKPFIPELPGSHQQNVVTVSDVLEGKSVGEHVVIVDTTGRQEACSVAEFLADQGKQVHIITPFLHVGAYLGFTNLVLVLERLESRGVIFTPRTQLKKISGNIITVSGVSDEREYDINNVDTVVMATGYRSNDKLYKGLKGTVRELHAVGDCVAPRRALDAIHEGYNIARTL